MPESVVPLYPVAESCALRAIETAPGLKQEFMRYLVYECNLAPLTAYTYLGGLRRLEQFCGKDVAELTVQDVRRFLRQPDMHPSTKNSTLVALKAFHRFGVLEGYWAPSAIREMRGPKLIRNPKPHLSADEARTLLDFCKRPNDTRLFYLGLLAGLRVSETASIGEDEWLEDRLRFMGKGRKVREVPLHPALAEKI